LVTANSVFATLKITATLQYLQLSEKTWLLHIAGRWQQ